MNRRAFLGAIGAILTAPAVALATKFEPMYPLMIPQHCIWGESFITPNGETITGIQEASGRLFVFTKSAIYELPPF